MNLILEVGHQSALEARPLILDLAGVSFIGSPALAVLIDANKHHPDLRVVCANRNILRIFEVAGLRSWMRVSPSLPAALPARPVRLVEAFRHDTLDACGDVIGQPGSGGGGVGAHRREHQRTRLVMAEESFQQGAPRPVRLVPLVAACQLKNVEDHVARGRGFRQLPGAGLGGVQPPLQRREVELPFPPDNQLAVEHQVGVKLGHRRHDFREVAVEHSLLPGQQRDPVGAPQRDAAVG